MGMECSAKGYIQIIDVIYCAQRAVLFPIAPLFDHLEKKLKWDYERALLRIFRICDKNMDNYLDDNELCDFQVQVFKHELQKDHITALKEVLRQECDEYDEFQQQRGISFEAFKSLQRVLILKMKLQTNWTILRHFWYDDNLQIPDERIFDGSIRDADLVDARNVEISQEGIAYLTKLFKWQCRPNENKIDIQEIEKIFSTTDKPVPWKLKLETVYDNGISCDMWVGLW